MFYFSLLKVMTINSRNIMAIQQIPVWYIPTNIVERCPHSGFEQIFPGLQPRLLTLEVSRIFIIIYCQRFGLEISQGGVSFNKISTGSVLDPRSTQGASLSHRNLRGQQVISTAQDFECERKFNMYTENHTPSISICYISLFFG